MITPATSFGCCARSQTTISLRRMPAPPTARSIALSQSWNRTCTSIFTLKITSSSHGRWRRLRSSCERSAAIAACRHESSTHCERADEPASGSGICHQWHFFMLLPGTATGKPPRSDSLRPISPRDTRLILPQNLIDRQRHLVASATGLRRKFCASRYEVNWIRLKSQNLAINTAADAGQTGIRFSANSNTIGRTSTAWPLNCRSQDLPGRILGAYFSGHS